MKNRTKKQIWITALFVSIVAVWIFASPGLELFFGINMPFITINHEQFTCFGYNVPDQQQIGFLMISGLLLMLPSRIMHLAILKLDELKRDQKMIEEIDDEIGLGQYRGYHSPHAYDEDGNFIQ